MIDRLKNNLISVAEKLIFFLSPLLIIVIRFFFEYRFLIFVLLGGLILLFFLTNLFFQYSRNIPKKIKKSIRISIINIIFLSLISFSGNLNSSFFFIIYFLLIYVALGEFSDVAVWESFLLVIYMIIFQIQESSINEVIRESGTKGIINIFSVLLYSPLTMAIASYFDVFRKKELSLEKARDLLLEEEIGDEALMEELNQGLVVTDTELNIIKVSKWVENELGVSASLLLNKNFEDVFDFYDPIKNFPIQKSDYFFKNLHQKFPKKLKWRIMSKNSYGKEKIITLIQKPIYYHQNLTGWIMLFSIPSKEEELVGYVDTFNQVLSYKISSSLSEVKNAISTLKNKARYKESDERYFDTSLENINSTIRLLEDSNLSTKIKNGTLEIKSTGINLVKMVVRVANKSDYIEWVTINRKYQDLNILADEYLLTKAIDSLIKGCLIIATDHRLHILLDQDLFTKKPKFEIRLIGGVLEVASNLRKLEVPFYDGDMSLLTKYQSTGLEISNASELFKYMGYKFSIQYKAPDMIFSVVFT